MSDRISYVFSVHINGGQLDAFREVADQMIENVAENEPGTLIYEWYLSDDNTACHVLESFTDSGAMLAHFAGAAELGPRLLNTCKITGMMVFGEPSPEGAQALEQFGAVVHRRIAGITR